MEEPPSTEFDDRPSPPSYNEHNNEHSDPYSHHRHHDSHHEGHNHSFEEGDSVPQGEGDANPEFQVKKRKARRAPRKKKPRNWKPYSEMNWEERKQLMESEAHRDERSDPHAAPSRMASTASTASTGNATATADAQQQEQQQHGSGGAPSSAAKRKQRRRNRMLKRVAPPPAPRITQDSIMNDREERTSARHIEDVFGEENHSGSGSDVDFVGHHGRNSELDFDAMLDDYMHDDLGSLTREELIEKVIASSKEIDTLNNQILAMKRRMTRLQTALEKTGARLPLQSPEKAPDA